MLYMDRSQRIITPCRMMRMERTPRGFDRQRWTLREFLSLTAQGKGEKAVHGERTFDYNSSCQRKSSPTADVELFRRWGHRLEVTGRQVAMVRDNSL